MMGPCHHDAEPALVTLRARATPPPALPDPDLHLSKFEILAERDHRLVRRRHDQHERPRLRAMNAERCRPRQHPEECT